MQFFEPGERLFEGECIANFYFVLAILIYTLLSPAYRPDLGDLALSLYEDVTTDDVARNRGISRSKNDYKYWAANKCFLSAIVI